MKEFEVTLRLRNNRLKQRRVKLGLSQAAVATAAGISLGKYLEFETLRRSPIRKNGIGWKDSALRLAKFYCVEPEVLFPKCVIGVKTPVVTRTIDSSEISRLLTQHQQRMMELPDVAYDIEQSRDKIQCALARLTPRDADILRMRFGLGENESDLETIVAKTNVSRQRIFEIEKKALRELARDEDLRSYASNPKPIETDYWHRKYEVYRKKAERLARELQDATTTTEGDDT